jgi:hypothetical protein
VTPKVCGKCNAPMVVRCPCGQCDLTTNVGACPTCEPDRLAKLGKMHGTRVCAAYVKAQLGS